MPRIKSSEEIKRILNESKIIAVVGMSEKRHRDSNSVARYLMDHGYTIIPVNPTKDEIEGIKSYPSLKDIPQKVDIVNVFRRPDAVPGIVSEAIEIGAKALWLQYGVVHEEAAEKASRAGLDVVMDECIKVEHRRFS